MNDRSESPALARAHIDSLGSYSGPRLAARLGTYFMIAATLLALVYLVDPTGESWGANSVAVLKYLPVEVAVIGQVFLLLDRRGGGAIGPHLWVLVLFTLMVFIGAMISLVRDHVALEDSYLGRGLALLPLFPAYAMFSRHSEEQLFRRWMRVPFVSAGVVITAGLAFWAAGIHFVSQPHIYHEEIFVPVGGALIAYARKRGVLGSVLSLLLLASGLLSLKNTGILASATAAGLIVLCALRKHGPAAAIMLKRVLLVQACLLLVAGAVVVVLYYRELLPSGSPAVRAFTYSERVLRFADHPIAGTFFVGSPLLSLFRSDASSNLYIPSHSDLLDILAFGGVIGFALFLVPLWRVTLDGVRRLPEFVEKRDWWRAYSVAVVSVFITEMAFNPVWNQPALVLVFCVALACLARAADDRVGAP
jgi:hypothetical protein